MSEWQLKTPVAFIIFNRPETTERVFSAIAKAKPPKLLVIADGPRENRPDEADRCAKTRAVIERVDWPCEVQTNFSEVNLGCKRRVSSGIDWVFNNVEEAIILEDDCLPNPSFFRFCQEMLDRYRDDERVAMISGDNFLFGTKIIPDSYYFSRYMHIWGWASWRRAWKDYDVEIAAWPAVRRSGLIENLFRSQVERDYWHKAFDGVFDGRIDTWDYQWVLSCWLQSRLAIMPEVNLISNIGFGPAATHTTGTSVYSDMATRTIGFPLRHPRQVCPNVTADKITGGGQFTTSLYRRVVNKIKGMVKSILRRILGFKTQ